MRSGTHLTLQNVFLPGVSPIFLHLGTFCNFNIIFNLVVGLMCALHQLTCLVKTLLLIELVFEIYVNSIKLQSKNPI